MIKIITVPDKRLRKKSSDVKKLDKKTLKLIADLKATLKAKSDPEGVGISAPQIGVNKRLFIIKTGFVSATDDPKKLQDKIIINPEILEYSKDTNWDHLAAEDHYFEGCLSIPEVYGEVRRPWSIKVRYEVVRLSGSQVDKVHENLSGFDAIYFQHEFDHLEGILFTDRILEQGGKLFKVGSDGKFEEIITN